MARLERGELAHRIPEPRGRDELAFAVRQFNRMSQELEAQRARLRETERIAAWQEVARALAHELGNPLTAMKMAVARLRRPARTEEASGEALALLDEELDVLLRMTRSSAEFARLPPPAPRSLDLAALVEEVCAVYGQVAVRAAERPTVVADPDQLRRALGNLVKNALEAGQVTVEVTVTPDEAEVSVLDDGPGVPAAVEGEALARGLGRTELGGRGLGLSIAWKIVYEHRGRLRLEPRAPRGTRAVMRLPLGVAA